jgi:glutamate-1-semialdehyde 2,1-aminomutase
MLASGLADAARAASVPLQVNAFGSLVTPFFTSVPVRDYESALSANTAAYGVFFNALLSRGIYPPPSQFEAWFLSAAHTTSHVRQTVAAAKAAMRQVRRSL